MTDKDQTGLTDSEPETVSGRSYVVMVSNDSALFDWQIIGSIVAGTRERALQQYFGDTFDANVVYQAVPESDWKPMRPRFEKVVTGFDAAEATEQEETTLLGVIGPQTETLAV